MYFVFIKQDGKDRSKLHFALENDTFRTEYIEKGLAIWYNIRKSILH